MANRREEKERLHQARIEAERREAAEARRRLILGYVVAGALGLLVVGALVLVIVQGGGDGSPSADDFPEEAAIDVQSGTVPQGLEPDDREGTAPPPVELADLQEAADAAGCELRLDLRDEGNTHLRPNDPDPKYDTSPPTSGDHDPSPLADGAFRETPDARVFIHSMEHGRVLVQYSPDLPESEQLALKGLFDADPQGMLLFPQEEMPYEVAATAWRNMIGCERYSPEVLDALRAFRDRFRGNGPELVPL